MVLRDIIMHYGKNGWHLWRYFLVYAKVKHILQMNLRVYFSDEKYVFFEQKSWSIYKTALFKSVVLYWYLPQGLFWKRVTQDSVLNGRL